MGFKTIEQIDLSNELKWLKEKENTVTNDITFIKYLYSERRKYQTCKTIIHLYEFKCVCGKNFISTSTSVSTQHRKSCGCRKTKLGKENKKYTGYEEISGHKWSKIKQIAKQRNIVIAITVKEAWELFEKQKRKCALTGVDLIMKYLDRAGNASLDRIDSSQGYIAGNIQWVHKDINIMKWQLSENVFLDWCQKIINYNEEKLQIVKKFENTDFGPQE